MISTLPDIGPIIEVSGLVKRYGNLTAVDSVEFEVCAGEVFGLLGPNGAGKTTTINMLTGLTRPLAGTIRIAGIDCSRNPKAAQHLIGVVPDESNLYPELTGAENLRFCGALYGIPGKARKERALELAEAFGLASAADRKFGSYSKGMKRRLTIAAGIVHKPPILILDEPVTGIDVTSARSIRQILSNLNAAGTTILLTTHHIDEAERLCHRAAFIVRGRILRVDAIDRLIREAQDKHVVEIHCGGVPETLGNGLAEAFPELVFTFPVGGTVRAESPERLPVGPMVRFLEDRGCEVHEARRITPTLEDVYVKITGIGAGRYREENEKP